MAHAILIGLYVLSALAEVSGIRLTVADVTVRNTGDGQISFEVPEGWQAARGPVLIVTGSS